MTKTCKKATAVLFIGNSFTARNCLRQSCITRSLLGIVKPVNEFTRILVDARNGDAGAANKLLPLVYQELRKLAAHRIANEKAGQTLQATALVHEAYLRLTDVEQPQNWSGRGHFFAAAAEAMRRILVENARRKGRAKRGGELNRIELSDAAAEVHDPGQDLLSLHEALEKLEARDARKAQLVKLRFFAGLTNQEAAEVLGISTSTADNDWAFARSWLRVEMSR
jgi:RNA polymerase sigma factor (TIGR02999 family)